jgi:hypothetical protein
MSLKTLINNEYLVKVNTNIILANAFNSIEKTNLISIENLYDKLSNAEKILKKDKYYNKMSEETKVLYREKLIHKAQESKEDINII